MKSTNSSVLPRRAVSAYKSKELVISQRRQLVLSGMTGGSNCSCSFTLMESNNYALQLTEHEQLHVARFARWHLRIFVQGGPKNGTVFVRLNLIK